MRILELPAGAPPREWGRIHGESFRGEIRALAAIRTYLCTKVGGFRDVPTVRRAADAHLPVLERYDAALFEELIGIAEGAGVPPADIVIANHYTDLRDLDPDPATWLPAPTHDMPELPRLAGQAPPGGAGDGAAGDGGAASGLAATAAACSGPTRRPGASSPRPGTCTPPRSPTSWCCACPPPAAPRRPRCSR